MSTAHTPGPWHVEANGERFLSIQNDDGIEAVFVSKTRWDGYEEKDGWKREKYTPVESAEADAKLIAAAPDLLEAARLALAIAESWIHDQLGGTSSLEGALEHLKPIRSAIAKATAAA